MTSINQCPAMGEYKLAAPELHPSKLPLMCRVALVYNQLA